jgi:hypothetical protein
MIAHRSTSKVILLASKRQVKRLVEELRDLEREDGIQVIVGDDHTLIFGVNRDPVRKA